MTSYIALTWGIFLFCCILIAFRGYGERYDTVRRRLTGITKANQRSFVANEELSKPLSERLLKPIVNALAAKLKQNQSSTKNQDIQNKYEKLKKKVYQAGLEIGPREYQIIQVFVILGAALLAFVVAIVLRVGTVNALLAGFVGFYAGYVGLRFYISSRTTKRRKAMEQQLPEVLDMLSVNVEAGLGFEQAILHVIEHFEGPLIDELTVTYREMSMGRTRRDALLLFGDRCDLSDIRSFTGAIVQAGQLGISIKNVLRTQAAAMRQSRRAKIEEKAQKISIKILIPMVIFIFPVIFIVLMGPAVVQIMENFG